MKKTSKKIVGGLMVVMFIATIGAVIASAVDVETNEDDARQTTFWGRQPMCGEPPFIAELTVEQREELDYLLTSLKEEGATPPEIHDAVQQKLAEFGIEVSTLDEKLDIQIERTEQRLEILNRKDELREQGYTWEEIKDIIQEEYDLDLPEGIGYGMNFQRGFRQESGHGKFQTLN